MLVAEAENQVAAGDEHASRAHPAVAPDAWERFLQERARESGCRKLPRWRDEEGL